MCFNAVVYTTVKPSNKGHIGDNVYSHVLSLVERLSFYQRFKIIVLLLYNYRKPKFLDPKNCPPYREVFNTVSLSRRVHCRRFHCNEWFQAIIMLEKQTLTM